MTVLRRVLGPFLGVIGSVSDIPGNPPFLDFL
jgi:hypothetical protein